MSFVICIKKNPMGEWNKSQGDRHLDFDFDGKDFNELHNFLNIRLPPAKQQNGENYVDFEERLKNEYLGATKEKGYEMLGRIWYWYQSVAYLPSEINQLLEECIKFKEKAQNRDQSVASDKLITACSEAMKTNSGIFLGSD